MSFIDDPCRNPLVLRAHLRSQSHLKAVASILVFVHSLTIAASCLGTDPQQDIKKNLIQEIVDSSEWP